MNKGPPSSGKRAKVELGGGYHGGKRVCANDDLRTSSFEKCGGLTTTEVCQEPMLLDVG